MNAPVHTIAVDVMGSDRGPREIINGIVEALQDREGYNVILVGDQPTIESSLKDFGASGDPRIEIVHASEVITMNDKPVKSLRVKKNSSMVLTIDLVQSGRACAMLSCGNTGSLMAGSTLRLRPMEGVERPALVTVMPTMNNYIVMGDVGANPNTTPTQMVHTAILSSDYCARVLSVEHPRVGLLTIGTEEGKGNELTLRTHELLKKLGDLINYKGLVEGFQIFEGSVDVVLCDGFVGNILLKSMESLIVQLKSFLRGEFKKNPVRMLGAFLSRGVLSSLRGRLNPETYGAASLLGLNGMVFKSHGSSTHRAIRGAMHMAASVSNQGANAYCRQQIALANDRIK